MHRIDVAFKAPCHASQGPGMSPALTATGAAGDDVAKLRSDPATCPGPATAVTAL